MLIRIINRKCLTLYSNSLTSRHFTGPTWILRLCANTEQSTGKLLRQRRKYETSDRRHRIHWQIQLSSYLSLIWNQVFRKVQCENRQNRWKGQKRSTQASQSHKIPRKSRLSHKAPWIQASRRRQEVRYRIRSRQAMMQEPSRATSTSSRESLVNQRQHRSNSSKEDFQLARGVKQMRTHSSSIMTSTHSLHLARRIRNTTRMCTRACKSCQRTLSTATWVHPTYSSLSHQCSRQL